MARDLFEQLADLPVPPAPPADFEAGLHQRLNKRLVAMQVLDLGLKAMPQALGQFALALVGLLKLTVTGRFEANHPRDPGQRQEPLP